jgi:hypothetical protein
MERGKALGSGHSVVSRREKLSKGGFLAYSYDWNFYIDVARAA